MDKFVVVFTMDGCPYCVMMKDQLNEQSIDFVELDIDKNEEEYELFKKITNNEFVPSFMIYEKVGGKHVPSFYCPERDFNEITEGVEIIKKRLV